MGAISQTNVNFVGSHCGVSIGEDGPSQMGLEDLAMFRAVPGSTVFYPCDAVSCERAVELAANTKGICYLRINRPATKILYANNTKFQVSKYIHSIKLYCLTLQGEVIVMDRALCGCVYLYPLPQLLQIRKSASHNPRVGCHMSIS